MKIKIQETINTLIKDDRVHNVIDADIVVDYYEKMYYHFDKNPEDFLFPNREWLDESLERLNIDLSDTFDESVTPDQIKREELITLFLILWVNMKIQDPTSCENIEEPYELFNLWVKDRVLIIRPTKEVYLHNGDNSVLNHVYKNYGWYTRLLHIFNIDEKGEVKYHYNSPDGIININKMYKRRDGNEVNDRCFLYPKTMIHKEREVSKIYYDIETITDSISELSDDILKEKERLNIIRPCNTKFVVREMTGMSNKEYKAILNKYNNQEEEPDYNYRKYYNDIIRLSGVDVNNDFILYILFKYFWLSYEHLVKALLKLKDKIEDKKDE